MKDRYMNYSKCIERLLREYDRYGRIILAVDFDNTIYDYHQVGDEYPYIETLLKEAEPYTNVMVFTCRPKKQHQDIKEYMDKRGLKFDTINEPILNLNPDDETAKPFYSLLLDDRACLFGASIILGKFIKTLQEREQNGN